jgi:hypothetical protein
MFARIGRQCLPFSGKCLGYLLCRAGNSEYHMKLRKPFTKTIRMPDCEVTKRNEDMYYGGNGYAPHDGGIAVPLISAPEHHYQELMRTFLLLLRGENVVGDSTT